MHVIAPAQLAKAAGDGIDQYADDTDLFLTDGVSRCGEGGVKYDSCGWLVTEQWFVHTGWGSELARAGRRIPGSPS